MTIPTGEEDVASYGRARNLFQIPVDFFTVTANTVAEPLHLDKLVEFNSASNLTYTVQADAATPFRPGNIIAVKRRGAGTVTLTAGAGVTINTAEAGLVVTQHGLSFLMKDPVANTWTAYGKLAAS